MRASLLAAIGLTALASSALADLDVAVRNRDLITGTLSSATEVETFRVVCPAGAALTVKARAAKTGPSLHVRVLDAADGVVAEDSGKAVSLKSVVLATSGEYRIVVTSEDGTSTGDYSLAISWKSAARFQGGCFFDWGLGGACDAAFAADAGATVSLSVHDDVGTTDGVALVALRAPDGSSQALAGVAANTVVATTGDYVLTLFADPVGFATIRVNPPKIAKRRIRLDETSVPRGGQVAVAGLVTSRGGGAAVGAGPLAGAQVSVPPGALRAPTTILVGSPSAFLVGAGTGIDSVDLALNMAGPPILVGPVGLTLRGGRTATVTIPFEPAAFPHGTAGLRVFTRSAAGVVAEATALTVDDGLHAVSFPAARFGVFQVFAPSGATEIAKLEPADLAAGDSFGGSLAVDGDYAVVGAPSQRGLDGSRSVGAAYVYRRVGSVWTEIQRLVPDSPGADDVFGGAVAISGDTIVVGAAGRAVDAVPGAGTVFVYVRSGSTFVEEAEFSKPGTPTPGTFGQSVAIDVDTVVVGAVVYDGTLYGARTAFVFARDTGVWTAQQEILGLDSTSPDYYGSSVDVSGDRAVVGAPGWGNSDSNPGAAHVWVRNGATWSHEQRLVHLDPVPGDLLGQSVAIDGDTVVAGASRRRPGLTQGAAFVFVRGASSWTQQAEVVALDGDAQDQFAESVALDGDLLVASARFRGLSSAQWFGAAYVFSRQAGAWTQRARLTASDVASVGMFGYPAALSGESIFIGAFGRDPSGRLDNAGVAYVFDFVP